MSRWRLIRRARLAWELLREYEREQAEPPPDFARAREIILAYGQPKPLKDYLEAVSRWSDEARSKAAQYPSEPV